MIGSELVQKYVGEGARLVRDLFAMARTHKACIIFIDEVDAIVSQPSLEMVSRYAISLGGSLHARSSFCIYSCNEKLISTHTRTSQGGARFDDGAGGDNEVQRTMLELITQLDGFDARGNIKVLMATNRPDTLDPALLRPGRLDRKVEFSLPDLEGRENILKIHARSMSCEKEIRFGLLARLCPNATGAVSGGIDLCLPQADMLLGRG